MSAALSLTPDDLTPEVLACARPDFFAQHLNPRYKRWPHVRLLAKEISNRLAQRHVTGPKHLVVSMPPRHGKTEGLTKYAPLWALNEDPELRVGIASYGARLARGFGRVIRNLATEHEGKIKLRLRDDQQAADEWETTKGGGVFTSGVDGSFTGRGFDLLLVDDPVKNWKDAFSANKRESVWEWFQSTAWTRLEPDGLCVIIMTRWHEDDLAGRVLSDPDFAEDFDAINLPAIAEDDDPLGRAPGEALCPARYPIEKLEKTKKRVGRMVWGSLYQGRPSVKGGGIFPATKWQLYDAAPEKFDRIIASWDMTFKETDGSDYVVGQVWGRVGADSYLLEQVRDRMSFVRTKEAVKAQYTRWSDKGLADIYIEDKANGPAVIDALRSEVPRLNPVEPDGSKEARAAAVSPFVDAGNAHLPKWQSWVQDFITEHESFPRGANDDQVDATSQALRQLYLSGAKLVDIAPDETLVQTSRWASPG